MKKEFDYNNIEECLDCYKYEDVLVAIEKGILNINQKYYLHQTNDIRMLKLLIEKGVHLNKVDKNGASALFGSHTEKTKLLLSAGIDINIKDKYGKNALWYSAWYPAKELIKNGINLNERDKHQETVLWESPPEVAKWLLDKGIDTTVKNKKGQTALFSVGPYDLEKAQLLVLNGVDINVRDKKGNNVLFKDEDNYWENSLCMATSEGEDSVDVFFINEGIDIYFVNEKKENPLFYGNFTSINMLLDKGVNAFQENTDYQYPLFKHANKFMEVYANGMLDNEKYGSEFFNEEHEVNKFIELLECFENKGFSLFTENSRRQNIVDIIILSGNLPTLADKFIPQKIVDFFINKGLYDDVKNREDIVSETNHVDAQFRIAFENLVLRSTNFNAVNISSRKSRI